MNATARTIPVQNTSDITKAGLARRAMLISLTINKPSGTKKVTDASKENAASHQAGEEWSSVSKRLWSKEAMQLFTKPAGAARKALEEQTAPWSKAGRILTTVNYEKVLEEMQKHEAAFWEGVESFLAHVEEHTEEARQKAGTLYDGQDYEVDIQELRNKFGFEALFLPLPSENHFRVNLSQANLDRVKEQLTNSMNEAYNHAIKDPWQRLYKVTRILAERLQAFDSEETKTIRSAIIDNVLELADLLPALNPADDPALLKMAQEAKDRLAMHSAKELKEDSDLRRQVKMDSAALARRADEYLKLL